VWLILFLDSQDKQIVSNDSMGDDPIIGLFILISVLFCFIGGRIANGIMERRRNGISRRKI